MKEGFGGVGRSVIGFQDRAWWFAVGFRRHIELVLAWCLKESVGGMGGVSGAEHLIASESVPPLQDSTTVPPSDRQPKSLDTTCNELLYGTSTGNA